MSEVRLLGCDPPLSLYCTAWCAVICVCRMTLHLEQWQGTSKSPPTGPRSGTVPLHQLTGCIGAVCTICVVTTATRTLPWLWTGLGWQARGTTWCTLPCGCSFVGPIQPRAGQSSCGYRLLASCAWWWPCRYCSSHVGGGGCSRGGHLTLFWVGEGGEARFCCSRMHGDWKGSH